MPEEPGKENPFAEYGLNPDGTPLKQEPDQSAAPKIEDVVKENVELKTKLTALEKKIETIPSSFEGMTKKFELLDKVIAAVVGDGEDAKTKDEYAKIFADFKRIAPAGVRKLLELAERDPEYLDKLTGATGALYGQQMNSLNAGAHARVVELAQKAGFRGSTNAEVDELVFPFERTMTQMINSNPELQQAFMAGNLEVVDNLFQQLIRPFVAQRLREKQARMQRLGPVAPPKSGSEPGATGESQEPKKPNIHTPQGRMAFHKAAVNRWLDKSTNKEEE